jgi:hypothetical protein
MGGAKTGQRGRPIEAGNTPETAFKVNIGQAGSGK